ncbi:MAG: FAD-dependent thymidylate synthase [Candidatus Paceibacterota bacterium]|jgi:thymidylate synthase (FAD)
MVKIKDKKFPACDLSRPDIRGKNMDIKEIAPKIWNFKIIGGQNAWEEVAYSARMSGVPPIITGENIFRMIVENDYGSALEHIIVKFDIKISKGNAPELLEHRMASHSGFSTRYLEASKGTEAGRQEQENLPMSFKEAEEIYEIIVPWHLLTGDPKQAEEKKKLLQAIEQSINSYQSMIANGIPREVARYSLPFCKAVGIYHYTMNLRSLLNFLSLRLCVRASAEMRCIASQLYLLLEREMPLIKGFVGCRGFMSGVCPESGVTGVRVGKPLKFYPPCPFCPKESSIYIPTRKEFAKEGRARGFDKETAYKVQKEIYTRWAQWGSHDVRDQ